MVWKWNPISPPSPTQTFIDVGAPLATADPTATMYVFWVGSDHSLWRLQAKQGGTWQQMTLPPGAGPVTRVAVAPDNTAWCITEDPALPYYLPKGDPGQDWKTPSQFPVGEDVRPLDVCVAGADSSVWMVTTNTQQWVSRTDGHTFSFGIPLTALAGFAAPVSSSNPGGAWGIIGNPSKSANGGTIAFCNGQWHQTPPGGGSYISNVVDIANSPKYLWIVKTDGTVWTTRDGISEVAMGAPFLAQRISGGYVRDQDTGAPFGETVYAVGQDRLPYVWADG